MDGDLCVRSRNEWSASECVSSISDPSSTHIFQREEGGEEDLSSARRVTFQIGVRDDVTLPPNVGRGTRFRGGEVRLVAEEEADSFTGEAKRGRFIPKEFHPLQLACGWQVGHPPIFIPLSSKRGRDGADEAGGRWENEDAVEEERAGTQIRVCESSVGEAAAALRGGRTPPRIEFAPRPLFLCLFLCDPLFPSFLGGGADTIRLPCCPFPPPLCDRMSCRHHASGAAWGWRR